MPDVVEALQKLAESGSRIRLAPGVIGKSLYLNLAMLVVWGIVLVRLSPTALWYDVALIGGATFVTLVLQREQRKNREYAEKNPELALMEGADITEYKRFVAQSKGVLSASPTTPVLGPAPVVADEPREPEHGS